MIWNHDLQDVLPENTMDNTMWADHHDIPGFDDYSNPVSFDDWGEPK